MNFVVRKPLAVNLDEVVKKYTYSGERFAQVESFIQKAILNYDPSYGPYLLAHLERTSRDLEKFMVFMGYTPTAAKNISHAFKLHDAGKTLQDIKYWQITEEKRERTPEEKAERPKHGDLGLKVLRTAIAQTGFKPDNDDFTHIDVIEALMSLHHERINGKGPKKLTDLGTILQMAGIIDGADGKLKAKNEDMGAVLNEMANDPKHKGEFNIHLLKSYARFRGYEISFNNAVIPQGLAIPSYS